MPSLDWIDSRILQVVQDAEPVKTWSVLNVVTEEFSSASRAEARVKRLALWPRIRRMLRHGMLFRAGRNRVATFQIAPEPATMRMRHPKRTVARATSKTTVSTVTLPSSPQSRRQPNQAQAQVIVGSCGGQETTPIVTETESDNGSERISEAARYLARLPRRQRRVWSGWLDDRGVRCYRNMPILLPGGEQAFVFGVKRRMLVFVHEPDWCAGDPDEAGRSWGVVPASRVRTLKIEHAVTLGKRKAGVKEKFSLSKIAAARRNGCQPPRVGSRARGRPRTAVKVRPTSTTTVAGAGHPI